MCLYVRTLVIDSLFLVDVNIDVLIAEVSGETTLGCLETAVVDVLVGSISK